MTKVISIRRNKNKIKPNKRNSNKVKFESLKNEKYKILLTLSAIISLLIGSLIYRLFPDAGINMIIDDKIQLLQNSGFRVIFFFLLKTDIIFFLISFFIGTSFIGNGFSFLSPMLKCIMIGYVGGYFYNIFELKGVLFCLVLLYPYFVITTASLIFASNESVFMSKYLYGLVENKNTADNISVRLYLLRYLLLLSINVVCAAVNSWLIVIIAPHINLQ